MNITINGTEVEVFVGARVKDALLKYSRQAEQATREGEKRVTDARGNTLDLEGALSENQQLLIQNVAHQNHPKIKHNKLKKNTKNNGGSL